MGLAGQEEILGVVLDLGLDLRPAYAQRDVEPTHPTQKTNSTYCHIDRALEARFVDKATRPRFAHLT